MTQGVFHYLGPNQVSVAGDDRIGAHFEWFIGEDGGVLQGKRGGPSH